MDSNHNFVAEVVAFLAAYAEEHGAIPTFIRVGGKSRRGVRAGIDLPVVQVLHDPSDSEICLVVQGLFDPPEDHPAGPARPALSLEAVAGAVSAFHSEHPDLELVLSQRFVTTTDFNIERIDLPIWAFATAQISPDEVIVFEVELSPER
jgi:hypothetical protein